MKYITVGGITFKKIDLKRIERCGNEKFCAYVFIAGRKEPVLLKEKSEIGLEFEIAELTINQKEA